MVSGNLIYNIIGSFSGSHPNAIEDLGSGVWYTYNNVVHDTIGEADFMANSGGGTEYIWNNIWYNLFENEPETGSTAAGSATVYMWNNTIVAPATGGGQPCIRVGHGATTIALTFENNQCISGSNTAVDPAFPSPMVSNNKLMLPSTAASQGYTSSGTYVYSPTARTNATVGAGMNLSGDCSGPMATLCSDTTYAVTYNTTNHTATFPGRADSPRPSSGAWDVGAYLFGGAGSNSSQNPRPPTGLTAIIN